MSELGNPEELVFVFTFGGWLFLSDAIDLNCKFVFLVGKDLKFKPGGCIRGVLGSDDTDRAWSMSRNVFTDHHLQHNALVLAGNCTIVGLKGRQLKTSVRLDIPSRVERVLNGLEFDDS